MCGLVKRPRHLAPPQPSKLQAQVGLPGRGSQEDCTPSGGAAQAGVLAAGPSPRPPLPSSKCGQCGHAGSWVLAHVRASASELPESFMVRLPWPAGSSSPSWIQHVVGEGAPAVTAPTSCPAQERGYDRNTGAGLLDPPLSPGPGSLLGLTRWLSERTGFCTKLRRLYSKHSHAGKSTL